MQVRERRNVLRIGQLGQTLLIMLLLLLVGASAFIYNRLTPAKLDLAKDKVTEDALEQARIALIGFAAGNSLAAPQRPGDLPCPDRNNNGQDDDGACNTVGTRIGRLPWITLGLPDLRDGDGERLWYAVSDNFKTNPRTACSGPPAYTGCLNADTLGDYTITGTTPANGVIAVVFSPGSIVGAQVRSAANQDNVAHYLEGGNQDGDVNFVTGLPTAIFNDKLLPVTSDAFFTVVNKRVAKEVRNALRSYYINNGYYPLPNAYTDASFNSTASTYSGRLPLNATLGFLPPLLGTANWAPAEMPLWYSSNYWSVVTHYAVSGACSGAGLNPLVAALGLSGCGTNGGAVGALLATLGLGAAGGPLTVDTFTGVQAVVIVSGRALGAQSHTPSCASVGQCLEDAENTNANNTYTKPSRFPTSNDTLVIVGCGTVVPAANCPAVP